MIAAAAARGVHVRQAGAVVRNAPSRWMASIFFQSAKVNSSSGCTIWMPALLTRMSTPPKASTTAATPALTWPLVGDVHGDGHRARRRWRSSSSAAASRRVLVQVGDRDLGAFAREDGGDLLADAAGRAGDDGDLVGQLVAHGARVLLGVVGETVFAALSAVEAKSNTCTPCCGRSRPAQRGSSSVPCVSAMPAAQCSSIEARENS